MSYTIYHANGTPVTVPDNAIDTTFYNTTPGGSSLGIGTQLVGRNAINYGAPTAQNFLQMTENFASSLASRPTDTFALQGQLWFEQTSTTAGQLYVRVSGATTGGDLNWEKVVTLNSTQVSAGGNTPTVYTATPASANIGDILVIGSVISIYAAGSWNQVFPAQYS